MAAPVLLRLLGARRQKGKPQRCSQLISLLHLVALRVALSAVGRVLHHWGLFVARRGEEAIAERSHWRGGVGRYLLQRFA